MRTIILSAFTCLLCVSVHAQDLFFATEGKLWNIFCNRSFLGTVEGMDYMYGYFIEGDTVIAGKACKKVYKYSDKTGERKTYETALYEDGDKVYCVSNEHDGPYMLYDFGCKKGDIIAFNDYKLYIAEVVTEEIQGIPRKVIYFTSDPVTLEENIDFDYLHNVCECWIEGIGSTTDLFCPYSLPGNYYTLLSCQENDRIIYKSNYYIHNYPQYYKDGDFWVKGTVNSSFLYYGFQNWKQMAEDNADEYEEHLKSCDFYLTKYFVEGDTVINEREYKRVHEVQFIRENGEDINSVVAQNMKRDIFFIHEEMPNSIPHRQVIRYPDWRKAYLLWDFTNFYQVGKNIEYGFFTHNLDTDELTCETKEITITDVSNDVANGEIIYGLGWGMMRGHHNTTSSQVIPEVDSRVRVDLVHYHNQQVVVENDELMTSLNEIMGTDFLQFLKECGVEGTTVIERESLTPNPSPKGEGGRTYDLTGREINESFNVAPGIYIRNGRKVLKK